jgi:hypothetical protein
VRSESLLRAALVVAALAFPSALGATGGGTGGLYGRVMIYPAKPVCEVRTPCSRPAAGLTLLFAREGRVVARTTTRKDGRYRLALAAGPYGVRPRHPSRLGAGLRPRVATVLRNAYRRVDFTYDIGIR